jgi:exodeoxyribonuclease-3
MKIASWNVNSIKIRLGHVQNFLRETAPDVLMLQELKTVDCPALEFKDLGYLCKTVGQKAYNGVCILSKTHIDVVLDRLPGDAADEQARYLEVETGGLRLINIYLPNGNPVDTEKYPYKLGWMERLKNRLAELRRDNIPFVVGGDFNVIPEEKDCRDPKAWIGDALFKIETRQAFRKLLNLGLTDAFRVFNTQSGQYTYWDYQGGAWERDNGIRIDHFLLSPEATDRLQSCVIDKTPRALTQPSDHVPIIVEIAA